MLRHVLHGLSLWICFIYSMIHLSVYAPIHWLKGHQIEWTSALTFGVCTGTGPPNLKTLSHPSSVHSSNSSTKQLCPRCILQWTSSAFLFQQASLVRLSKHPDGTKAQDRGGYNFPLQFWTRLNTATVSTQGLVGSTIHQKGIGVVLLQEATGLWPSKT